jgi:hypothetical protein
MIKHSLDVTESVVQYINPGQTPVITIAQDIQWTWPEKNREDKFIILLKNGRLHIESSR